MEWSRLYANLADDPRVQRAEYSDGAGWLLIESMCYCTSAETDGFIPHTQIERFSGGTKKARKIAALVREQIWLPVDGGYMLNPDLWTEERNLGDSAEKKRQADRDRMRKKRAETRAGANGHESRDCRATCSATSDATQDATSSATGPATCSSDSRALYEKREEKTFTADPVSHPSRRNARGSDDDDLTQAVIGAVLDRTSRLIPEAVALAAARKVLARAERSGVIVHNPARYVARAVADETDLYASLLLDEPPPLAGLVPRAPAPAPFPAWCRECDQRTRMREDDQGRPYRCPECHPLARLEAS